jgi:glucosylceramidase
MGLGGAFTEAAAFNFYKLSERQKRAVLRAYFAQPDEGGHGYAIGRNRPTPLSVSL